MKILITTNPLIDMKHFLRLWIALLVWYSLTWILLPITQIGSGFDDSWRAFLG